MVNSVVGKLLVKLLTAILKLARQKPKRFLLIVFAIVLGLIVVIGYNKIYFVLRSFGDPDEIGLKKDIDQKVENSIDYLIERVENDISEFEKHEYNTWTSGQLITALNGRSDLLNPKYHAKVLNDKFIPSCGCVRYYDDIPKSSHVTASAWGNIGLNQLMFRPANEAIDFLLSSQSEEGFWSLYIDVDASFASTYVTSIALLSLKSYLTTFDVSEERETHINLCLDKGYQWLIDNAEYFDENPETMFWLDYPKRTSGKSSPALTGLVIHTVNKLYPDKRLTIELNKRWLCREFDDIKSVTEHHRSDVQYPIFKDGLHPVRDVTRYLIFTWEIIATVDAYKDGTKYEKYKAELWLDKTLRNLNLAEDDEFKSNDFMRSEVLIGLRYLTKDKPNI